MKPGVKKSRKKVTIKHFKRKIYTEENLQKALKEISKGMSKKLAAKTFNIPRSTLQFRIKHPDHSSKPGPATILTDHEEQLFVDWIKISSRKGFPKRKDDVIKSVSDFINKSGRESSFKNGEKWFKLFLGRHPTVTFRTPEAVTAASSTVSEDDVRGWFEQIRSYMTENNYFDILADPSRVFNGDETNFILCPKTGLVLSLKGEKNVYEVDHAQAKTSLTVMFTFGANGQLTPPMVIFPYKRLPGEITSKIPEDWGVGLSENGWMNSDIFFEYIKNVLHPHLLKTGTQFPIVLFVDGHKSHLTYAVSELCTSLDIILIALYPNCTRLLQPADVAAFKPFKTQWQKTVLEWRRTNPSQALTKTQFVPLLKDTIEKSLKPSTIINGFRATGLCPWNEDEVDYTKCLGTKNKTNLKSSQPNPVKDDRVLTKYDFIKLLGESAINRIIERGITAEESSNYLRKIWDFFTGVQNHLQLSSELKTTNETNNISNFDIENMEIIFTNSSNENAVEQNFDLVPQDVVVEAIDFMEDMPTQQVPIQEIFTLQPPSQPSPTQQAFNQLESIKQVSTQRAFTNRHSKQAAIPHTSNQQPRIHPSFTQLPTIQQPSIQQAFVATPQKPSNRVTSDVNKVADHMQQAPIPQTYNQQSCIHSSFTQLPSIQQPSTQQAFVTTPKKPCIRVTSDVKIGANQKSLLQVIAPLSKEKNTPVKLLDILVVPKTPKRKGVKNSVKMPFVLTSAEWKAQEDEKKRIKEEKAEGVKKRKEERERKKLEKEKKPVLQPVCKAQENEKKRIKEEKADGVKKRKEERQQKKFQKEKKPVPKSKITNKAKNERKNEVTRVLFSEDFYTFKDGIADTVIENIDRENQKENKQTTSARTNYTTAEIEKMLSTDSDD